MAQQTSTIKALRIVHKPLIAVAYSASGKVVLQQVYKDIWEYALHFATFSRMARLQNATSHQLTRR